MDDGPPEPGLSLLYAVLGATVEAGGWDALAIVVEDPGLGRQVFAAGTPGLALAATPADAGRTWWTVPASGDPPPGLDALRALATTALRLAALDETADPTSALEVALRRRPEVVAVERRGTAVVATVAADHLDSVTSGLAATARPALPGLVVLRAADPDPASAGAEVAPAAGRAELVAVRSMPESGELEVHLRLGDHRTVGRGALSGAGAAAAAATLDALGDAGAFGAGEGRPRVAWVRTIDTTPDRRFLVAVAVGRDHDATLYGLATGASPIEAAARATLHACNRISGRAARH